VKRKLKDAYKWLLVRLFHFFQRFGFDVLPRHFYSEIPAIFRLRNSKHWREPYSMHEVSGASNADEQLHFVRSTVTQEVSQAIEKQNIYQSACHRNGFVGYGPIESEFLYAFVRKYQPKRIIQIGCGVTTAICLAASKDSGYQPELTCIEPYPNQFLLSAEGKGDIRLVRKPVELIGLEFLDDIGSGDLFFVDSTHTLGPAGEVTRIILEMLPRLSEGAYVHFHDIWFPYDYEQKLLSNKLFFWHESALLHAFLCMNRRYRVMASLSMLHFFRTDQLGKIFSRYEPMESEQGVMKRDGDYPSSIYLQVGEGE